MVMFTSSDYDTLNRKYEDYIASPPRPLSASEIASIRAEKEQQLGLLSRPQQPLGTQFTTSGAIANEAELAQIQAQVSMDLLTAGQPFRYYKESDGKSVEISRNEFNLLNRPQNMSSFDNMSPVEPVDIGIGTSKNIDSQNKNFLMTGKTVNPFTGENIFFKPDANKLNFESAKKLAQIAYAKASGFEKGLLNLGTLRTKGYEYLETFGNIKASEEMTINFMTESLLAKRENEIKVGPLIFNEFSTKSMFESVEKTETGIAGKTLFEWSVAGAGANYALSKSSTLLKGANKVASLLEIEPGLTKVGIGTLLGVSEGLKFKELKSSGASQNKMILEGFQDVTNFGLGMEAFRVSLSEGLGIKFIGKKGQPAEKFVNADVLSGKEQFSVRPKSTTAKDLLTEFQTSPMRYNNEIGGWHTTAGSNFKFPTTTMDGSSEFSGMFISPDANLAYTRLSSGESSASKGAASLPINPTALWIKTDLAISDIPRAKIGSPKVPGKGFLYEQTGNPTGFIFSSDFPKVKAEAQAVIPPGVGLESTSKARGGFSEFFTYKDVRIPIMPVKTVRGASLKQPAEGIGDFIKGIDMMQSASKSVISSVSSLSSALKISLPSSKSSSSKTSLSSGITSISVSSDSRTSSISSGLVSIGTSSNSRTSTSKSPGTSSALSSFSSGISSPFISTGKSSTSSGTSSIMPPSPGGSSSGRSGGRGFSILPPPPKKPPIINIGKSFMKGNKIKLSIGSQKNRYMPSVGGLLLGKKQRRKGGFFTGLEIRGR